MTNDRLIYGILFSIYLCLLIVYEPGEGSRRVCGLGDDTLNNKKHSCAFIEHHFKKYIYNNLSGTIEVKIVPVSIVGALSRDLGGLGGQG